MKLRIKTKKKVAFVFVTTISVVYLVATIWLFYAVNSKRNLEDNLRDQISIVVSLEENIVECLYQLQDGKNEVFYSSFENLVQTDFNLDKFQELTKLSEETVRLKKFTNDLDFFNEQTNVSKLKNDLKGLYSFCIDQKTVFKKHAAKVIYKVNTYWDYIYFLMILASFLSLILIPITYMFFRSKRKIHELQIKNSLFVNSVGDCVIFCDNNGDIIEYNKPSVSVFGYSINEALGRNVKELYGSNKDWDVVHNDLEKKGFFKGEIINKNKKGDHFVSYLSANIVYDDDGNISGTVGISRDITSQKRTEEQFQHIVDNATDIIYTTNIEGEITYVNSSANNVLGYLNGDFNGMSFREFIHPDYLSMVENHYNEQFKNRTNETYLEFKMVRSTGEEIWIGQNVRTTFSPTDKNKITGYFGILRNLNELKKVEFKLLKSEKKYRELVDNSKDMIQSIDPYGNLLYVNEAWKITLGYSDDEIKSMNLFAIIHEDSKAYCENILTEILKVGDVDDYDSEHIFKAYTKTGDLVVLRGRTSVKYEKGQVKSLQTFLRNITERYAIEQALKRSEENFRSIGNSINDVFFLYNIEQKSYEYISPNCEAVLGASSDFFYSGESYAKKFMSAEDQIKANQITERALKGISGHFEYKQNLPNGEVKWIDEKWFPINENDKTICISGVCRDITEVKDAYDIIFDQNKEISQSILYAKNIQEATLPTTNEFKRILPDSFVFYKAKDVLSGDLYLVENVRGTNGNIWPSFIVGDCTGHGVPGGLLSLLCSGLLRESITNDDVDSPAKALDFVREKLIRLFRSNPSKYILDGMDAAFCVFNTDDSEIHFSGANLSCYIVRNEEVTEYRGDRQHIGYNPILEPFVHFSIDIEPGDAIYLTTDGYVDQFGGPKNKKFLKKRFTELLLRINDLPMEEQGKKIEAQFYEWKGDGDQTDDIAMIGVRV